MAFSILFRTGGLFSALALSIAGPAPASGVVANAPVSGPVSGSVAQVAGATTIELRFTGIATPTGAILASIFDSAAAYAGGKPVRAVRIPVAGTDASQLLEGLAPGSYAVKAFHDIDGDNQMGMNPFGMPLEPFAFSNDAPANMGPPMWEAARFEAGEGPTVHIITIK
jgi:uncharacterized protein (DUF2141 family)